MNRRLVGQVDGSFLAIELSGVWPSTVKMNVKQSDACCKVCSVAIYRRVAVNMGKRGRGRGCNGK